MSECGPHHTYRGTPIDCEEAEGILRARINDLQRQAEEYEARFEKIVTLLTAEYKVANILGADICDLCGGDLTWPAHEPECVIGQVLAIARANQRKGD